MLTVNLYIQNRLINGQTGNINHAEFIRRSARKVYVTFSDKQADLIAMRLSDLSRQNSWISIDKCESEIPIKKGPASLFIKRTQFPLILAWSSTVHKVQGLSLEQGVFKSTLPELNYEIYTYL